jgi:hypothetical protein
MQNFFSNYPRAEGPFNGSNIFLKSNNKVLNLKELLRIYKINEFKIHQLFIEIIK